MTKKHLFDKQNPPICEVCNDEITVAHILLNCRKYDHIRRKIGLSNNIQIVLNNNKKNEIKLLKFVKECKLDQI